MFADIQLLDEDADMTLTSNGADLPQSSCTSANEARLIFTSGSFPPKIY